MHRISVPWIALGFGTVTLLAVAGGIAHEMGVVQHDSALRVGGLALMLPFAASLFAMSVFVLFQGVSRTALSRRLGPDPASHEQARLRRSDPTKQKQRLISDLRKVARGGQEALERELKRRIAQLNRRGFYPVIERSGTTGTIQLPVELLTGDEAAAENLLQSLAEISLVMAGGGCREISIVVPEPASATIPAQQNLQRVRQLLNRILELLLFAGNAIVDGVAATAKLIVEVPRPWVREMTKWGWVEITDGPDRAIMQVVA